MTTPRVFPRAYLLNVYAAAYEHGYVLLHPISAEDAPRFTQSFYRLRRRSDKAMASLILPEYHLITVGRWTPANGGSLPIYYNEQGDTDIPLPTITPVEGKDWDLTQSFPQSGAPDGDDLEPFDPDAFVQDLIDKSQGEA